ncbi:uncharacterized protein Eint_011200 [Encephalitozoon intestinalis ATCC 50506]|uniref:Uncharacterized protein n=1 Tax=Encephalitozoon intestinalis (strain ATCC 50506) TaxID=876142 RepID=E0S5J7_ENCIT|nr:uncharacterized protein Eint_011200 [Encephalitozoon intestinalis ATCC 50506]ADM10982.1 hypothetical protein Eint_011200 [Encephalitozoon intestinalis ATCC 50506]UTX44619.1 hypothetical protein GPK93_01g01300 [Encephalitozoon intestinalis]
MIRKSLFILVATGMGIIKATGGEGGLYIPSTILRELGSASMGGYLMIAETGNGDFGIVSSSESPYIIESGVHSEVAWQPVNGDNRAVPVYAPSPAEIRESIPTVYGEPSQYMGPQQEGFVPASTPVVTSVEETGSTSGVSTGAIVAGTTAGVATGAATGAAVSSTTSETKDTTAAGTTTGKTSGDKTSTTKDTKTSTKTKKKGAKSLVALSAVAVTALFSIL